MVDNRTLILEGLYQNRIDEAVEVKKEWIDAIKGNDKVLRQKVWDDIDNECKSALGAEVYKMFKADFRIIPESNKRNINSLIELFGSGMYRTNGRIKVVKDIYKEKGIEKTAKEIRDIVNEISKIVEPLFKKQFIHVFYHLQEGMKFNTNIWKTVDVNELKTAIKYVLGSKCKKDYPMLDKLFREYNFL